MGGMKMPRNMSFMLTTEQIKNRTKTVTRRLGWKKAREELQDLIHTLAPDITMNTVHTPGRRSDENRT